VTLTPLLPCRSLKKDGREVGGIFAADLYSLSHSRASSYWLRGPLVIPVFPINLSHGVDLEQINVRRLFFSEALPLPYPSEPALQRWLLFLFLVHFTPPPSVKSHE